jgi:hypothetical protein
MDTRFHLIVPGFVLVLIGVLSAARGAAPAIEPQACRHYMDVDFEHVL